MLRAFFLALGISSLILGVECLLIDKAEMHVDRPGIVGRAVPSLREVEPPEWAPWSLMSIGAVMILYTFTIPQKMKSG